MLGPGNTLDGTAHNGTPLNHDPEPDQRLSENPQSFDHLREFKREGSYLGAHVSDLLSPPPPFGPSGPWAIRFGKGRRIGPFRDPGAGYGYWDIGSSTCIV